MPEWWFDVHKFAPSLSLTEAKNTPQEPCTEGLDPLLKKDRTLPAQPGRPQRPPPPAGKSPAGIFCWLKTQTVFHALRRVVIKVPCVYYTAALQKDKGNEPKARRKQVTHRLHRWSRDLPAHSLEAKARSRAGAASERRPLKRLISHQCQA